MTSLASHITGGPRRTKKPLELSRVELYLQLEGCIRATTLWELMVSKKIPLPDTSASDGDSSEYKSPQLQDVISFMISHTQSCKSLIIKKLQLCIDVLLDDEEALQRVCHEISEDCHRNGVKYFEISLNPYKFLGEKSSENANRLIRSVLDSFKKAQELTSVKFGLILQYDKGMKEEARNLLSQCKDLKEENVVGLELAETDYKIEDVLADDSENVDLLLFPPDDIAIFEEAKAAKIHRSVHAGEFGPSDAVFQAIEKLGAERVIAGYSVLQAREHKLSNTSPSPDIPRLNQFYHPIVQFAEENVSFSVNTGMPVITGGGLDQEICLLKTWGLTETHLTKAVFNSARSAFLEDKKKKELQKELRKAFGMEDKVELEIMINHNCGMNDEDGVQKKLKVSF